MIHTDITLRGGGYIAAIHSADGAVCYRLCAESLGAELLRTPACTEDLEDGRFVYGTPILFPPNRIHTGAFVFEGRTYRFPVNEPATDCHLHGMLHRMPFAVTAQSADHAECVADFAAGEYLGFPHAFSVTRAFALSEDGLCETTTVANHSAQTMPVMLAFHTTFRIPMTADGRAEDYRLQLPVDRLHLRDSRYLPTGSSVDDARCEALRSGQYTPCAYPDSGFFSAAGERAGLCDIKQRIRLCYEVQGFGYWLVFNGGSRDYLCIEPQSCMVDAFHRDLPPEQAGVIALPAGKQVSFRTRLWAERF